MGLPSFAFVSRKGRCSVRGLTTLSVGLFLVHTTASPFAAESDKKDDRYPFRTDFANAHLPWYQTKALEFPPHHSDSRIGGELISADFVHRTGQFRVTKTGEIVNFTMPPYATVSYLNSEAHLRDVPLGTFFLFFLHQDRDGKFTKLATMQDQFTMDASHQFSYRLDEVKAEEGKLLTTKHSPAKKQDDLGKKELLTTPATRFWKDGKAISLTDLKAGDELLYNLTGKTDSSPGTCTDVWVGTETHQKATADQEARHVAYVKQRGLPGWVESTNGKEVTITLFSGDRAFFEKTFGKEFGKGNGLSVAPANDELRTWNPPVDKEGGRIFEVHEAGVNGYGTSGRKFTCTVSNMQEGFRKGNVVRVIGSGWPGKDCFFGESLMNYGYGAMRADDFRESPPKEYPEQFPFRTDYGNVNLPWYQVKEGVAPPRYSEHVVWGDLLEVDATGNGGKFRQEGTGTVMPFTLLSSGAELALNSNAPGEGGPIRLKEVKASVRSQEKDVKLAELPLGQRYRFHLYQDEKGSFSKASYVCDDYSYLAQNSMRYRVLALDAQAGHLDVGWQHAQVKNYNGDMEQPPDFGQTRFQITPETRAWKDGKPIQLEELKPDTPLLVNLVSGQTGKLPVCREIWVNAIEITKK